MTKLDDSRIGHDEAALLLPWHVTGRLSDLDARRVQRHLAECRLCADEAAAQQSVKAAMCGAPAIDYTPQASLAKLMERIDAQEQSGTRCKSWSSEAVSWLSRIAPRCSLMPRRSARVWIRTLAITAGVQAMAIVVLIAAVGWFALRSAPSTYRTLTNVADQSTVDAAAVRVVFDESLRVDEMHSLLRSMSARIVSGPTAVGAYTLRLDNDDGVAKSAAEVAGWLRVQPGVRFAEPVVHRE